MSIIRAIRKGIKSIRTSPYRYLDRFYLALDRKYVRRTRNIRSIPTENNRRGGKYSYAEWAHVIGIFQTLINLNLEKKENNRILDVGCGTGLLAIASEPFLGEAGRYTGIDVMRDDIEFCQRHYDPQKFDFIHFDLANPSYAPDQSIVKKPWPIESASMNMVVSLSVWTHMNEADATFYFRELGRTLKPGGKAIVTFFLLDATYRESLDQKTRGKGKYHMTSGYRWVFDQPSYGSDAWFHTQWARSPEDAIGITEIGLQRILAGSGMKLTAHHQGNWKEIPGVFFQDVLIFEKSAF